MDENTTSILDRLSYVRREHAGKDASTASSERTAYTWLPDTRIEFCSPYSRRKSSNSTVFESD